jgi:hypothetical protein
MQRVTRGDAQAILNAGGTGGLASSITGQALGAAPADVLGLAAIRPYADHAHYCVEDWHAIANAVVDGGDRKYTRERFEEAVAGLVVSFTLDGTPLASDRTPIMPFLAPELYGWKRAFYFQQGTILPPEGLVVGEHKLGRVWTESGVVIVNTQITFYIDAAGVGRCQQNTA